jgi:hypothetical protein
MRAEELRIGNYAQLDGGIECIDVYDLLDIVSDNFIVCNPIPLTEEWLLKFGFKKDVDGSFAKNDISIFLDKRFKTNLYLQTNESDRKFNWFGFECKIKYVHQLQNLYFALTGEELTIKN